MSYLVLFCSCVVVFFSPFGIAITSLGEERANLSAFRTFVRFALVWFCLLPLPIWCLGRAAICYCGIPWTFLLPFFYIYIGEPYSSEPTYLCLVCSFFDSFRTLFEFTFSRSKNFWSFWRNIVFMLIKVYVTPARSSLYTLSHLSRDHVRTFSICHLYPFVNSVCQMSLSFLPYFYSKKKDYGLWLWHSLDLSLTFFCL